MIEVKNLTKFYGEHKAVSNLSFTVEKGQIYGFLGPNGAGKSTTMNIMTGCLGASSGEVKIGGYDIFEEPDKAKSLIGYLPEQPPLYQDRTPREYLRFVGRAKRIPKNELEEKISEVMEVTQISDVSERLIKNLSKGYKQRIGIAQAILGDPEIIILDEPTVGLDPMQIIEIRDLIKKLGKDHTVILSSHILSEVQAICQTILIISKGKLVACDTTDNLEKMFAGRTGVDFVVEAEREEAESIINMYLPDSETEINEENDGKLKISLIADDANEDSVCRKIFFAFADSRKPILKMNTTKASLEDVFIELTSGEKKEKETFTKKNGNENEALKYSDDNSEISNEISGDYGTEKKELVDENIENFDSTEEVSEE